MGRAEAETLEQFASCWEGLEDPRRGNARLRNLHELLMIALCCVLCCGQGAVDMALFAKAKEPFLRSFLTLANGLHWGVENSLDWRLDVVMNEDQDRTRMGHGPENLTVLRHMAINAMQKEGSKGSLRGKFKRAAWDDDFLYRLLVMF